MARKRPRITELHRTRRNSLPTVDATRANLRTGAASASQRIQCRSINGLAEVERDHILRALETSDWVISAAAARLGMKRTSLAYRMKKLSICGPAADPQKRYSLGT